MKHFTETVISWNEINELVEKLYNQLQYSSFDYIVGIGNGGLIPAVMISNKFHNKFKVLNLGINSYTNENLQGEFVTGQLPHLPIDKSVLIIDDINDSGNTFKYVQQLYKNIDKLTYAALLQRDTTNFKQCLYSKQVTKEDGWVVMPWE